MAERAKLSLGAGCDTILVCNDRDAAHQVVDSLHDYSNPLSLVRLARLHGTGQVSRDSLLASDEWQAANSLFAKWSARPELELNA